MPRAKDPDAPPRLTRSLIAAHALCDERAVKRAYLGEKLKPITYRSICEAAKVLGLDGPPEQP